MLSLCSGHDLGVETMRRTQTLQLLGVFLASCLPLAGQASAADYALRGNAISQEAFAELSCDNGRTYPLVARAVTTDGDVVTGYIVFSPRRSVHVRLVPMEEGYRYAGRGVWLDGVRGTAELNLGKHSVVSCNIS